MIELIKRQPVLFIAAIILLIAVVAIVLTVVIKAKRNSDKGAGDKDIFLNAPTVKIEHAPEKVKKSSDKEADFAWLKK